MILSEYRESIMKIPEISRQFSSIGWGQPPYSDGVDSYWKYGDSADSVVAGDRLRDFMKRTGVQIYEKILPFDNPVNDGLCSMCHELKNGDKRICERTNTCTKAPGNRYCGHPDTAVIYPGIESLLTVLFMGGVITSEDFAKNTAYLRVLARKFSQIDSIARWSHIDGSQEGPGYEVEHIPSTFRQVFGRDPTSGEAALTIPEKLLRNRGWQRILGYEADKYVPRVVEKIKQGWGKEWSPQTDQLCRSTTARIGTLIGDMETHFWSLEGLPV